MIGLDDISMDKIGYKFNFPIKLFRNSSIAEYSRESIYRDFLTAANTALDYLINHAHPSFRDFSESTRSELH